MQIQLVYLRAVFCLVLCGASMGAASARAQAPRVIARAEIPFAFQYGAHVLAPGSYEISTMGPTFLVLRGGGNATIGLIEFSERNRQLDESKLVFLKTGDTYTLQDVWTSGVSAHLHVFVPKGSRKRGPVQLAQQGSLVEVASKGTAGETAH